MTSESRRSLFAAAAAVGVTGDLLLQDGPVGLGFSLWIALLAVSLVPVMAHAGRRAPQAAAAWLVVAVLAAGAAAWRNAPELRFLDIAGTATALGGAALLAGGRIPALLRTSLAQLAAAAIRLIGNVAAGMLPLLGEELRDASDTARDAHRWRVVIRSSAIGVALLVLFGGLLRGADPLFASLLSLPSFDVGIAATHVVLASVLAWIFAGWSRAAVIESEPASGVRLPAFLGAPEITTALGVLNLLFAAYVATQIAWFFGGETFLRAHTGLTAAEYARRGFFQMVWVVLLVVPVLLATRAAMRPEHGLARRHTALALPLIALVGAMIVSAVLRMKLYVGFYGLTTERLYPLVFMAWLAFVLLLICATVLRDRGGFTRGILISGFVVLGALNVSDPDGIVARVNLARAERAGFDTLDVAHLSDLHGGAVPIAVSVVVDDKRSVDARDRCTAARRLIRRWGATSGPARMMESDAAWRSWTFDDARATSAVIANARRLREVARVACARRVQGIP